MVLSGAICTKNGKALMARQFVEMSRIRIEGLLAAFPKLLGSGGEKQHTFIETDTVRCVRACIRLSSFGDRSIDRSID